MQRRYDNSSIDDCTGYMVMRKATLWGDAFAEQLT